jgi:L-cysteine/cystine lyase
MSPISAPDAAKVRAAREALPATAASIYLNTGTAGPLPIPSVQAMQEFEDLGLRLGRGDPAAWPEVLERMAEARATLAVPLGARPDEIALTHSATDGLNQAIMAIDWRAGDEVITTDQEHPGLLAPLLAAVERSGLRVRLVQAGGAPQQVVEAVRAAIGPRTRLIALSHVLWTTGALLPIRDLATMAAQAGAWTVVDGAQGAGAVGFDVRSLGVDFYAFSGQKWLLGPEGMGGLWVSERALLEARQGAAGYLSYEHLTSDLEGQRWTDARRFEASGFHRPSIVGLARSVGWLAMQVGLPWALTRGNRLARWTAEHLAAIDGVQVLTPMDQMADLVSFRIAGWSAQEALEALSAHLQVIARTIPDRDALRLSVAFFNTEEELEQVVGLVGEMVRHTPASLPRRPPLVIIRQGADR